MPKLVTMPTRAELERELRAHGGSTLSLGGKYDVSQKTVCRWIARLELRALADELQRGAGGARTRGGRPRKTGSK